MTCTIDARGLSRRMETSSDLVVLDVLLPEHYQAHHIPGALNACVYEVVFLDNVHKLIPDKNTPLVVYDSSKRSQASATAAAKLQTDGYTNVCDLSVGIEGWLAAGYPLEPRGARLQEEPKLVDRTYRIDTEKSLVTWTGRNLNRKHFGNLSVSSGELKVARGELSGHLLVDMKSLANLDLQDPLYRDLLINHLISEDFFEVERYPTAAATITGWLPVQGATPGSPNYRIAADLTIKGVTRHVEFDAVVIPEADCVKAQAALNIDRTAWNVCYGSGKIFEKLGGHLVHDLVTLEVFIVAV